MPSSGFLWQSGKFRFFDNSPAPMPTLSPTLPLPPPENRPIARYGLTELYTPPSHCEVDLVFVHGLNGDPKRTWTSRNTNAYWPRDLLPSFVEEQRARVLTYGYDAEVASLGAPGVSKDRIHNHAERLVADLFANRRIRKATERPIIFIAHSLGGLVVKRALISSSEISGSKTEHLRSIYVSTYGILFLGTPHKGSNLANWGTYLSSLCQAVIPSRFASTEGQLIEAMKINSETLLNIDRQFSQIMDDFHIFFFHEAKPMNIKGALRFIVEEDSAAPALPDVERAGIQADHSEMCKFDSEFAPGFDLVVDGLQRYSEQAPGIIKNRWTMERRERLSRAFRKAKENYPGALNTLDLPDELPRSRRSTLHISLENSMVRNDSPGYNKESAQDSGSSSLQQTHRPTEPFFIVPPGFRANTFFVGMEKEMHELDNLLFDSRREDGTASALLHGQPGAGKTHVARQYVFKNRHRFQGGVFWINAHLIDEVYRDFWQIHQRVVAKISPDIVHNSSDNLDRTFIDEVRDWFGEREEWLIVFDGVSVEHERDIEELQRFIPDSPNSSIIYVSRSRRLETMQGLLRPTAIKISGLKEDDARDLLFKELGVKKPRPAQIKSAKSLAKKVGGLPLAISAIARRLADTHEPIEKFNIKSYSDDPKLGGTYHHIMNDLRKNSHTEAINLMNLLCFFGPHIPVEMIRLGLKPLTREGIVVKASEEGVHPDINVTLGILMRHALIERNEPDDNDSISSSRNSYCEPEPIDVLNLHAVIQKYWCDSLNTNRQLPIWLARASTLLTSSFREADLRIRRQSKPGRLSDYRWYLVHARRLRMHTLNYDSKNSSLSHIRSDLDAVIAQMQSEIQVREPSSSQESLSQAEFQMSIFDRTSINSSTEPSQTGLDGRRSDSLSRVNTEDFDNAMADNSSLATDDFDYQPSPLQEAVGMNFPILYSYPMQKDLSGSTIRPGSNVGRNLSSAQGIGTARPPLSPTRSDSFRSASAIPLIDRGQAQGLLYAVSSLPQGGVPISLSALSYLTSLSQRNPMEHVVESPSISSMVQDPQPATDPEVLASPYGQQHSNLGSAAKSTQLRSLSSSDILLRHQSEPHVPTYTNPSLSLYDPRVKFRSAAPALESRQLDSPGSYASSLTATYASPQTNTSNNGVVSRDATPRMSSRESPDPNSLETPPEQAPASAREPSAGVSPNLVIAPPLARIRSVSPLPRGPDHRNISPFPQRPVLQATAEVAPQYTATLLSETQNRNPILAADQPQSFPYALYGPGAPYSDPLPIFPSSPGDISKSAGSHQQPRKAAVVRGLGITQADENTNPSSKRGRQTRRRPVPQQSNQRNSTDRRGSSQSTRRELAPIDPNLGMQAILETRGLEDLSNIDNTLEFTGIPAVSFAPSITTTQSGMHHRIGLAANEYGSDLVSRQQASVLSSQLQQQQGGPRLYTVPGLPHAAAFVNPFAYSSNPAVINTAHGPAIVPQLGMDQLGGTVSLEQRGAPNRNSAPFVALHTLAADQGGAMGQLRGNGKRRRTLSAPESPGWAAGTERNFWGA